MYSQILLTSLLVICTQQTLPNQPLSSYSILEMPTPKKYVSPGTVLFPEPFFHNTLYRQPESIKGIQYAPMHERKLHNNKSHPTENIKQTPNGLNVADVNIVSQKAHVKKDNIEPKAKESKEDKSNECIKCYNLGLNTEVLPYASRSPGLNAVYRNLPHIVMRDKTFKGSQHTHSNNPNEVDSHHQEILKPIGSAKRGLRKINYLKPYGIYQVIAVPGITNIANAVQKKPPDTLTDQELLNKVVEFNTDFDSASVNSKRHLPVGKLYTNRLHMNIARMYNSGQQEKIPSYADIHSLRFDNVPRKLQPNSQPKFHTS